MEGHVYIQGAAPLKVKLSLVNFAGSAKNKITL